MRISLMGSHMLGKYDRSGSEQHSMSRWLWGRLQIAIFRDSWPTTNGYVLPKPPIQKQQQRMLTDHMHTSRGHHCIDAVCLLQVAGLQDLIAVESDKEMQIMAEEELQKVQEEVSCRDMKFPQCFVHIHNTDVHIS